jgi:translation initiation factor 2 gamma subunit (eIF-2gamma)
MSSKSLLKKITTPAILSFGLLVAGAAHAEEDVAHAVTGIVKHVDHASKVVVKAEDGTEHTIKYSEKTSIRGGKQIKHGGADAWLGTKEGAKVTVRYTSKAGEETAIGVKDAAEKTGDALKN